MTNKRTTSEAAAIAADEDLGASNFGETVAPVTAHTPGPWRIAPSGWSTSGGQRGGHIVAIDNRTGTFTRDENGIVNLDGRSTPIAYFYTEGYGIPKDESSANARLIAAAPDLLAALKSLVGHEEPGAMFSERIQKALAAIAKAEGRS